MSKEVLCKKLKVRLNRMRDHNNDRQLAEDAITNPQLRPCFVRLRRLSDKKQPVFFNGILFRPLRIRVMRIEVNDDCSSEFSS